MPAAHATQSFANNASNRTIIQQDRCSAIDYPNAAFRLSRRTWRPCLKAMKHDLDPCTNLEKNIYLAGPSALCLSNQKLISWSRKGKLGCKVDSFSL